GLNAQWDPRGATFLQVIGRLRPGVSVQQTRNDIADVMLHVAEQYPQYAEPGEFPVVTPLTDYILGNGKPAILLLWAASILLLGIACINIGSLLVARAIVREKEIAIRLALGATPKSLLWQFIAEGLVLSSAGAVAGCAFARVFVASITHLAPPAIPRLSSVDLNLFSLLFACGVSLVVALAFGLTPAILVMRRDVRDSLNENGTRTAGSRRGAFFRRGLLAVEAVVTILLLTSAGMVVHNFYNLQRVRLGFLPENTLTAQINLANVDASHRKAFFSELLGRLNLRREVKAAGAVLLRPFEGNVGWDVPYRVRGQEVYDATKNPVSNFEVVTPGYFQAVGTPLLAGRYFTLNDDGKHQNVAIISESLARRAFGDVRQSVGQQITLDDVDAPDEKGDWCSIVGVVADAQYRKLGVTEGDTFVPFLQTNIPVRYVAIRTNVNPAAVVPILMEAVEAIDKGVAVSKVVTMEQLIAGSKTGPRFSMLLFSMFGIFAGLLAAVGVYGLVSDTVVQRRREIGIRMALGAQRRSVLLLIIQGEMSAITLGGFLGIALSFGLMHVYAHFLYGLQGIDFLSLTTALAVLISVSLATSIIPAMTAAQAPVTELLGE
ncbi:MAG: FtsX-like permease family protein, partial [Candidatus Acidiferrum sp.]